METERWVSPKKRRVKGFQFGYNNTSPRRGEEEGYMQPKKPVVVGIGEILWDVLPAGKRAGGAPVNFVYHAAQLGAEGYAVSAVGNDVSGTEILEELDKNRIAYAIETVSYPTGSVPVTLKDGVPSYTIVQNVAWDHIPLTQTAVALVRRADAVCYGTLASRHEESRQTVQTLLSYARKDALRFFDVNLRQAYFSKGLIETLLGYANVFKMNDEELIVLRSLFGVTGTDEAVCREFVRRYNLRYLIFTAADKYSVIYTPDGISRLETPKVNVADTVGAGDAFSGAFVVSVLTGKTLRQAHEAAVKIAAFVVSQTGAWPAYNRGRL